MPLSPQSRSFKGDYVSMDSVFSSPTNCCLIPCKVWLTAAVHHNVSKNDLDLTHSRR